MSDQIWRLHVGDGPLVATAIHAGGDLHEETFPHIALEELERLREQDPFTDLWTEVAPTRVLERDRGLRSISIVHERKLSIEHPRMPGV